jgi:hypothetical protein
MNKTIIKQLIDKYYISDEILPVLITVENDVIKIPFMTVNNNLSGYVMKKDCNIVNLEFGVFHHRNFSNNIALFDEEINIEISPETLILSDSNYTIEYLSADKRAMSYINDIEVIYSLEHQEFDVKFIFDKEFINKFLKASSADTYDVKDTFSIKDLGKNSLFEFTVGKVSKIKWKVEGNILNKKKLKLFLNMNNFRNVLSKNKDVLEGYLSMQEYLVKIEFINSEGVHSTYFMPPETNSH